VPTAPTALELTYPVAVGLWGNVLHRVIARLLPESAMQGSVIFLPAGGDSVEVYPDGTFRTKKLGVSKIYAIPANNTSLYKAITIEVIESVMRKVNSGSLRLTGSGNIRFT
jgi:hypothetical protein